MSRAGYNDYCDGWDLIRWRGAVKSAIRGKRGQEFLRELLTALDTLPEKRLISGELKTDQGVCAIGSVGVARGIDMSDLDVEYSEGIAARFGIADALVREIEYINDDNDDLPLVRVVDGKQVYIWDDPQLDEKRFKRVRAWVVRQLEKANG